jgi:hypothetical protein
VARQRLIGYPAGRLLAVVDDPAAVDRAIEALAAAGIEPERVERLTGGEAASAFDATGSEHGVLARVRRAFEFSLVDQLPDLAWYAAAAREGRTVLSVPARDSRAGRRAAGILAAAGAHFINRYGRFETEDIAPWRGPEPSVDDLMKR